jgi:hypothetical protein
MGKYRDHIIDSVSSVCSHRSNARRAVAQSMNIRLITPPPRRPSDGENIVWGVVISDDLPFHDMDEKIEFSLPT